MSAFIVDRAHIDTLVLAGAQYGVLPDRSPDTMRDTGATLWATNHASVNARYRESTPTPEYREPPVSTRALRLPPAVVAKAIACYEYQSREHRGWENSDAQRYCRDLRHALLASLPGYEAAPWEVNDVRAIAS